MYIDLALADLIINGATLTVYVRNGHEFIATAQGGDGGWIPSEENDWTDVGLMDEMQFTFGWESEQIANRADSIMVRWFTDGIPFKIVGLPNFVVLYEDETNFVMLPRTNVEVEVQED